MTVTSETAHFEVGVKQQHLSLTDTDITLGQCIQTPFYEYLSYAYVQRLWKSD